MKPPDDIAKIQLAEIPNPVAIVAAANEVVRGRTFPPQQQILLYAAQDWEEFVKEWVHYQKTKYLKVVRLTGAGDMGIDVAGLADEKALHGVWDCYQCKHYADALTPTVAYPEIGKILWHSFNGAYNPPRKYYFIAPKSCGPKLIRLLLESPSLKNGLKVEWDKLCSNKITSQSEIKLAGGFARYVDDFDFSIFTFETAQEIIDQHSKTPYHTTRFGGGLPNRPLPSSPPTRVQASESRYIEQLYTVYAEESEKNVSSHTDIVEPHLSEHFDRQREYFYSAEALRNFARDAVPEGTFEELKNEVYAGVIDLEGGSHPSSMTRLTAVTQAAAQLQITSNGLISVTKIQDRRGICHQLANEDRLQWKK